MVTGLAAGSMYHGYSNPTAARFLNYQIGNVIDLTSAPLPVSATSALTLDVTALFKDATYPPLYGYSDGGSGFLSLCQLFEQGVINEVWIQDGGDATSRPRAPLYAERKQEYDADWKAIPGTFQPCLGGNTSCLNVSCGVTVRIAHLDPAPSGGPGCDVSVRGWGIDSMWSVLPGAAPDANAFLNLDFNTRFPGVSFTGWPQICAGSALCISYPSPTVASNAPGLSTTFTIDPFLQGCGNSYYPSNGTFYGDFQNSVAVDARCEHFGLRDGAGGHDLYTSYPSAVVADYDQTVHRHLALPGRLADLLAAEHARIPEPRHRDRRDTDEELVAHAVLLEGAPGPLLRRLFPFAFPFPFAFGHRLGTGHDAGDIGILVRTERGSVGLLPFSLVAAFGFLLLTLLASDFFLTFFEGIRSRSHCRRLFCLSAAKKRGIHLHAVGLAKTRPEMGAAAGEIGEPQPSRTVTFQYSR